MLRRLAVLWLAIVPLILAGCGQRPLLQVGAQRITVQPNAANDPEEQSIGYTVGAQAHVTVTLVQPNGQRMTLRDNDRAPDSYSLPFGGVVDVPNSQDKKVLANGAYKLIFQATSAGGQSAQRTVDAIVKNADPVPLQITDVALSLPVFAPNGQGTRTDITGQPINEDQTTFNYALSKDAKVSISVVDSAGAETPVQALQDKKKGLQSFQWDGKGANGIALKDGKYTFHIHAEDKSGNVTDRTGTVTIQNSGTPALQIMAAKFSPTDIGLGGTVNVEITVKNIGDTSIRTLGPPPGTKFSTRKGYMDPSFNRPGDASPPYVDTAGRWRVVVTWTSAPGQYPARWGFFADDNQELAPGQQVTIRGSIQVLPPQPHDLQFTAAIEMGGIGFSQPYGQTQVHVAF